MKSGYLEGIEGILARKKNVWRLVIAVDLLGKAAAVEIDAANVEPVGTRNQFARSLSFPERACVSTGRPRA